MHLRVGVFLTNQRTGFSNERGQIGHPGQPPPERAGRKRRSGIFVVGVGRLVIKEGPALFARGVGVTSVLPVEMLLGFLEYLRLGVSFVGQGERAGSP